MQQSHWVNARPIEHRKKSVICSAGAPIRTINSPNFLFPLLSIILQSLILPLLIYCSLFFFFFFLYLFLLFPLLNRFRATAGGGGCSARGIRFGRPWSGKSIGAPHHLSPFGAPGGEEECRDEEAVRGECAANPGHGDGHAAQLWS